MFLTKTKKKKFALFFFVKEKNRIKILTEGLERYGQVRIFESEEIFKNEGVTEPKTPIIETKKIVKKKKKIRLVIVKEFHK